MKLGVKNINKIYSILIYSDSKKKAEIINSVCECPFYAQFYLLQSWLDTTRYRVYQ